MPSWDRQTYEAYLARRAGAKIYSTGSQRDQAIALEKTVSGASQGAGRIAVRFVFCRMRLLDRDGSYASAKDLLDGLRYAGLIPGDTEAEIDLQVEQIKTPRANQKTVIEITYP